MHSQLRKEVPMLRKLGFMLLRRSPIWVGVVEYGPEWEGGPYVVLAATREEASRLVVDRLTVETDHFESSLPDFWDWPPPEADLDDPTEVRAMVALINELDNDLTVTFYQGLLSGPAAYRP